MLNTSARLLHLLTLLETRREWPGGELASRLEVTTRTLRNDIVRLRALGYPVMANPGVAGGYRLGAGAALPPLLLDDAEAVAVALALRSSAGGGVAGIEETSVRALVKLEQVLPTRLRRRVNALQAYTVAVPVSGPTVERAGPRDHGRRLPGPRGAAHRLVARDRTETVRPWSPAAGPLGPALVPRRLGPSRDAWRTFRADRLRLRTAERAPVRAPCAAIGGHRRLRDAQHPLGAGCGSRRS